MPRTQLDYIENSLEYRRHRRLRHHRRQCQASIGCGTGALSSLKLVSNWSIKLFFIRSERNRVDAMENQYNEIYRIEWMARIGNL